MHGLEEEITEFRRPRQSIDYEKMIASSKSGNDNSLHIKPITFILSNTTKAYRSLSGVIRHHTLVHSTSLASHVLASKSKQCKKLLENDLNRLPSHKEG